MSELIKIIIALVLVLIIIIIGYFGIQYVLSGSLNPFGKSYDRGTGTMPICPPGMVSDAGLCYPKPKPGYSCTATICSKNCSGGYKDDGLYCQKDWYDRGVGIPFTCPPGKVYDAGLCYNAANQGYSCVGTTCTKNCPAGFRDDGLYCAKPESYGRGGGRIPDMLPCSYWNSNWRDDGTSCWEDHKCVTWCNSDKRDAFGNCFAWDLKTECSGCGCIKKTAMDRKVCKDTEDKVGELCYPKCKSGFHAEGCCVCSPNCPFGYGDIGVSCTKPSYDRGVGTAVDSCPDGYDKDPGGLCYPKCQNGYTAEVTMCRKTGCPDSTFTDIGISCQKPTYDRGVGKIPDSCSTSMEYEAGLCYPKCKPGYKGFATMCIEQSPSEALIASPKIISDFDDFPLQEIIVRS